MRLSFSLASVFLGLLSATTTAGEAAYRSSDIVKFFEAQKMMATTRGICVGSETECAADSVKNHASGFDLLVNFEKDSAALSDSARGNLTEFAVALHNPSLASLRFAIDGFTDASGPANYNLDLSKRRAAAVVSFLKSLGVSSDLLEARGWGASNFRTADRFDPSNRRVETRLWK
jgi:outer membrane protein OmpA-like peptidoglycan-associated protein